jgi:hypothetical protein
MCENSKQNLLVIDEKVANYKVLDLFKIYNFDIKFVLIQLCLKKIMKFNMLHLFLETALHPAVRVHLCRGGGI